SGLGYRSISGVRQGKYFEIALDAGSTREQAQKDIDTIARDVLTNPVIEEYRIEFIDSPVVGRSVIMKAMKTPQLGV
ncbi:MAG: hypothetical protein DMG58_26315, partial [Acidobacteria bacterium]